jgi:hypothetical protein
MSKIGNVTCNHNTQAILVYFTTQLIQPIKQVMNLLKLLSTDKGYNMLDDLNLDIKNESYEIKRSQIFADKVHARLSKSIDKIASNKRRNEELAYIDSRQSSLARKKLSYMNPAACTDWHEIIFSVLTEATIDEKKHIHMITLMEAEWHQRSETLDVSYETLRKMRKKILAALKGKNFVGMIEFSVYVDQKNDDGYLIIPHFHGIIWDVPHKKRRKILKLAYKRFSGGMNGSKGCRVDQCTNFGKLVSYSIKALPYGYRVPDKNKVKHVTHTSARFTHKQTYKVFRLFKELRFPDLFVCGGEGKELGKEMRLRAAAESRWIY